MEAFITLLITVITVLVIAESISMVSIFKLEHQVSKLKEDVEKLIENS